MKFATALLSVLILASACDAQEPDTEHRQIILDETAEPVAEADLPVDTLSVLDELSDGTQDDALDSYRRAPLPSHSDPERAPCSVTVDCGSTMMSCSSNDGICIAAGGACGSTEDGVAYVSNCDGSSVSSVL